MTKTKTLIKNTYLSLKRKISKNNIKIFKTKNCFNFFLSLSVVFVVEDEVVIKEVKLNFWED